MSVISLLLCCSMLIGTTFAWFTDEVVSGTNQILAGNLDVELYHSDKAVRNEKVTTSTKLFDDVTPALWEPGAVAYEVLTVANEGTLAMKYNLAVLFENATVVNGKTLADALKVAVVDATKLTSREAAIAAGAGAWKDFASFDLTGTLEAGKTATYGVVIYWEPTDNDNIFNMNNENKGKTLSIDLGIKLTATQLAYEEDSFGDDYDGDALVCDIVATPETINEILATVEPGTVIGLAAGEYGTITLTQNSLTLVSNTAVVGLLDLNEKDNIVIDGLTFNAANAQTAYNAGGAASEFVTNLTDGKAANGGSVGVVIKNCAFVGTAADSEKYIPVYFGDTGRGNRSDVITIEGCAFQTNAKQYIALNGVTNNSGSTAGEIVIKNNIFGGNGFGTSHNSIQATGQGCNWTIIGNKFNNWNVEKTAIGSSSNGNLITWTITGNDFCNEDGAVVLALKTSYTDANTVLNFAGNTAWGGNGILVATPVNGENEAVYGGHKIQMNDGVAMVDTSAEFTDALKSAANGSVILLTGDVTVDSDWDSRYTGGKTTKEVVIDGAGNTLKITGKVADNNYNAVFRFEGDAVVKNLTIDLSEAGGYGGKQARAISAKGNLVVDNCTFIGNTALSNTRAIVYGEGQTSAQYDAEVSITNCTFVNWKRGITDNENAKDIKSVVVEGNTCTNAPVYVSAYGTATVVNNTMNGSLINITSYSAAATAKVVATGNVLDAAKYNVVGSASKLFDAANVTVQEGFVVNTIA